VSSAAIVKEKVQRILIDDLDLSVRLMSDGYQVAYDSTAANIEIIEQGDTDENRRVVIRIWALIVRDVPGTPELFKWLAEEGGHYIFGSCTWNPNPAEPPLGMVSFDYAILGDYLDSEELSTALGAVITVANELDEQLQEQFGGKRFVDE